MKNDQATSFTALVLPIIQEWYESRRRPDGNVYTNVMCVALVMVEHLITKYPLEDEDYLTETQVRGIGATRIRTILSRQRETRPFRAEAGRTTRGSVPAAKELATRLNKAGLGMAYASLEKDNLKEVRDDLQKIIVGWIQNDFFGKQFIAADIDSSLPVRSAVEAILGAARKQGGTASGAVAQHLVGAKLAIRFPQLDIANEGYTVADQQTNRPGDFHVGDTAFHVTMSPSAALLGDRCRSNRTDGYRPVVIVPYNKVEAARQLADTAGLYRIIEVLALEDFVGQNIEELGAFRQKEIRVQLRLLLECYNERVSAAETDPALRIKIPDNL